MNEIPQNAQLPSCINSSPSSCIMSTRGALGSPSTRQIITWQLWLCGVSGDHELGKSLSSPCRGRVVRSVPQQDLQVWGEHMSGGGRGVWISMSTLNNHIPLHHPSDQQVRFKIRVKQCLLQMGLMEDDSARILLFKLWVERISAASSHQHCTFCGILWVYLWFQFKPIIDRKGLYKEILCYTLTPASSSNLCVWSGNNDDLDLSCKTLT